MDFRIDRWPGDGPTVVLLHAGVADRRSWDLVARELPELDVVAYDRRGFGETPPADEEFSHLDDLMGVLDEIGATGPVWLVGSSMGGGLALDAALTRPERVAGVVVVSPGISGAPEPPDDAYDEATRRRGGPHDCPRGADDPGQRYLWLDGPAQPEGRVTGDAATSRWT